MEIAERLNQPQYLTAALVYQATIHLLQGRVSQAEEAVLLAYEHGKMVLSAQATQIFAVQMLALRREQGRMSELLPALEFLARTNPTIAGWRVGIAYIYAECDREVDARREFSRLSSDGFPAMPRDQNWLMFVSFTSEVCGYLADAVNARVLRAMLEPYSSRNAVLGSTICGGPVSRYLGILAAACGDWNEAEAYFGRALAISIDMGAIPFIGQTKVDWARMLLRRGHSEDLPRATQLLHEAQRLGEDFELEALCAKARRLAIKIGGGGAKL
jgi:tetratricopeptide (TPR) repeat protein